MANVFILYYDYRHTSGNHAGMAHLARTLAASDSRIKCIRHPDQQYKGGWIPAWFYSRFLAVYLRLVLKPGDQVVFFEYLSGDFGFQDTIVRLLRRWKVRHTFSGFVHLGGAQLLELYGSPDAIRRRLGWLDRVLVFGSSLYNFLQHTVGYSGEIVCTYHYADTEYYRPSDSPREEDSGRLQVLFLGAIKRNLDQLAEIVSETGDSVDFHVCTGRHRYPQLEDLAHVTSYGYLREAELLALMQRCHVNLSVFYDTVGSNAITGTLAVGLAQVSSLVGSIEDYGDPSNSIWCGDTAAFVEALQTLASDRRRLQAMQISARQAAERMSLRKFITVFNDIFLPATDHGHEE